MKKHACHHHQLLFALLLGAAMLPLSAAAQAGCELVFNIVHCPIGEAALQVGPGGSRLRVTNLGPEGNDGVSSEFDTATHWRAKMNAEGSPSALTFQAMLDGDTTASAEFRIEHDTNQAKLTTAFTGAEGRHTFRVLVFQDGVQVADLGEHNENATITVGRIPTPEPIPPSGPWPWPDFRRYPNGSCSWLFTYPESMRFTTSEGYQADGDSVRLLEVIGPGHYLYTGFTAILTNSDADALEITDEEISN